MANNYILSRLFQTFFTIFIVVSLSFALIRLIPGGPMDYLKAQLAQRMTSGGGGGGGLSPEAIAKIERITNIRPDEPMYIQYIDYMVSVAQGDFGRSVWYSKPVGTIIGDALPWTVFLMSLASFSIFFLGIVLGGVMAYYEGSRFDSSLTIIETLTSTVPYYVFALFLLEGFAYTIGIFPQRGRMATGTTPGLNAPFILGVLHHAALPFLSLVIAGFGTPALQMRGNSINVLGSDYLRVGRLRGLSEQVLSTRYVVRNAVLPMYTGFMISLAALFGGSVILERIFKYPGMGFYLVTAFRARDYPLMMAGFIILTTATIVGVLIADLTYGLVDPRIKTGEQHESF